MDEWLLWAAQVSAVIWTVGAVAVLAAGGTTRHAIIWPVFPVLIFLGLAATLYALMRGWEPEV